MSTTKLYNSENDKIKEVFLSELIGCCLSKNERVQKYWADTGQVLIEHYAASFSSTIRAYIVDPKANAQVVIGAKLDLFDVAPNIETEHILKMVAGDMAHKILEHFSTPQDLARQSIKQAEYSYGSGEWGWTDKNGYWHGDCRDYDTALAFALMHYTMEQHRD